YWNNTAFYTTGTTILDGGAIATSGDGLITANAIAFTHTAVEQLHGDNFNVQYNGAISFDADLIRSDGSGNLSATSFIGDGSGLTNLPLPDLSGVDLVTQSLRAGSGAIALGNIFGDGDGSAR